MQRSSARSTHRATWQFWTHRSTQKLLLWRGSSDFEPSMLPIQAAAQPWGFFLKTKEAPLHLSRPPKKSSTTSPTTQLDVPQLMRQSRSPFCRHLLLIPVTKSILLWRGYRHGNKGSETGVDRVHSRGDISLGRGLFYTGRANRHFLGCRVVSGCLAYLLPHFLGGRIQQPILIRCLSATNGVRRVDVRRGSPVILALLDAHGAFF